MGMGPARRRAPVMRRRGVQGDRAGHRIELGQHLVKILGQGRVRGHAAKWIAEALSIFEVDIVADVLDGKGPHAVGCAGRNPSYTRCGARQPAPVVGRVLQRPGLLSPSWLLGSLSYEARRVSRGA